MTSVPGLDHPEEQTEAEITLVGRGISVSSRVEVVHEGFIAVRPSVGEFVEQVVVKVGDVVEVKESSKQLTVVLEASQLGERDVPDFIEVDHSKMTAKYARIPHLSDVPFAVQMEPHLIVEFYSR